MIANLRPYAEYRDSKQLWIGAVPKHWEVLPNRALFLEVKDREHPDEEMLSVTITKGIIRQKALLEGTSKKDSSNLNKAAYKLVQPCDLAYNKMRAWQGAIGESRLRGIISPAYVVMRPRNKEDVSTYFHHLFRTPHFAKEAERWSYGITSDMWSLRPEHFKMIYAPRPPLAEQSAIVHFVTWLHGRLERAMRAKKRVIALLNEQKQAVIHLAVTRGLDASAPLKHSSVPFIGDIPAHWQAVRLARVIKYGPQNGISPSVSDTSTLESFSISAVRNGVVDIRENDRKFVSGSPALLDGKYSLLCGDILLVRGNGNIRLVGKAGIVPRDIEGILYPDLLMRIRTTNQIMPEFLTLTLNSPVIREQIESAARTAVGTFKINNQQVRQLWIGLPGIEEQKAILHYVAAKTAPINEVLVRTEHEIAFLSEYRTRLVADVVTGKLDVRQAAVAILDEDLSEDNVGTGDSIEPEEEGEEFAEEGLAN